MKKIITGFFIILLMSLFFSCSIIEGITDEDSGDDDVSIVFTVTSPSHPHGSLDASIDDDIILQFDRNMKWSSFENRLTIRSQSSQEYIAILEYYDPNSHKASVSVPFELRNTSTGKLESAVNYTLILSSGIEDAGGLKSNEDSVISFTTFNFTEVFDDSSVATGETFGITYDPVNNYLFYATENSSGDYIVRRYTPGASSADTVLNPASSQVIYGGLSYWDSEIYIHESYDDQVSTYSGLTGGSLSPSVVYNTTTLATATLAEVRSAAKMGDTVYFTTGNWNGGTTFQDIYAYDTVGTSWSVFATGSTYGFDGDENKVLTVISPGGSDFLLMLDASGNKLYKFNSGGTLIDSLALDYSVSDADLAADDGHRIFIGTGSGVYVYDRNLVFLKSYPGLDAERITVKNGLGYSDVYYIKNRDSAVISRLRVYD